MSEALLAAPTPATAFSPAVSAFPEPPLDESLPGVQAFLALNPRGLSDEELAERLKALLADVPPLRLPSCDDDYTLVETILWEASGFLGAYQLKDGQYARLANYASRRERMAYALARYSEDDVLRRWGVFTEFRLCPFTVEPEGRVYVRLFHNAEENTETAHILCLPGTLDRTEVDEILGHWTSGYWRGRTDGKRIVQAKMRDALGLAA